MTPEEVQKLREARMKLWRDYTDMVGKFMGYLEINPDADPMPDTVWMLNLWGRVCRADYELWQARHKLEEQ